MEWFAQIMGFLAMATIFVSFQVKNPRGTLVVMGTANVLFAIHFGLLGAVTGSLLNVMNVIRSLAILYTDPKKQSGKIIMHCYSWLYTIAPFGFLLIPGVSVGIPDFILGAIMTFACYCLWTQRSGPIRLSQLCVISPGWMWYNILAHSLPGILTETMNMLSVILFYLRQFLGKTKKSKEK